MNPHLKYAVAAVLGLTSTLLNYREFKTETEILNPFLGKDH